MSKVTVSCLRQVARGTTWSALVILAVTALVISSTHIEQRIFRWHAERLLSDIREINLRQTQWSNAQALMKRWGEWGHYEGSCTEEHCYYEVILQSFGYKHSDIFLNRTYLRTLYQNVGGRPAEIWAHWEVQRGRVWGKGFAVHIQVPPRRGQTLGGDEGYTLIGESNSVSHFRFDFERVKLLRHANYVIGTPTGCENCRAVYAKFTPYTDPSDMQRLLTFNLACISAWHPCRERGEIMPLVWQQYLSEQPKWNWDEIKNCRLYPLELLGRDSEHGALVEVIASHPQSDSGYSFEAAQVRMIEPLKEMSWRAGTTHEVRLTKDVFYANDDNELEKITVGRPFIILLERGWKPQDYNVESCGLIPMTGVNLAAVKAGIVLDYQAPMRKAGR